jgi:hypothetical protein
MESQGIHRDLVAPIAKQVRSEIWKGRHWTSARGFRIIILLRRLLMLWTGRWSKAKLGGRRRALRIVGQTVAEFRRVTTDDLIAAQDGLPPEKIHCPTLPIAVAQDALSNHDRRDIESAARRES